MVAQKKPVSNCIKCSSKLSVQQILMRRRYVQRCLNKGLGIPMGPFCSQRCNRSVVQGESTRLFHEKVMSEGCL